VIGAGRIFGLNDKTVETRISTQQSFTKVDLLLFFLSAQFYFMLGKSFDTVFGWLWQ